MTSSRTVTSEIVTLDRVSRVATIRRPDGSETDFAIGDAVRNLAQVDAGDILVVESSAATVVALARTDQDDGRWTESRKLQRSEQGARPRADILRSIAFRATVDAADEDSHTVTLRTTHGLLKVSVAPEVDLSIAATGTQVECRMEQRLTIGVDPS